MVPPVSSDARDGHSITNKTGKVLFHQAAAKIEDDSALGRASVIAAEQFIRSVTMFLIPRWSLKHAHGFFT